MKVVSTRLFYILKHVFDIASRLQNYLDSGDMAYKTVVGSFIGFTASFAASGCARRPENPIGVHMPSFLDFALAWKRTIKH